jgi:hypothetical protein
MTSTIETARVAAQSSTNDPRGLAALVADCVHDGLLDITRDPATQTFTVACLCCPGVWQHDDPELPEDVWYRALPTWQEHGLPDACGQRHG